MADVKLPPMPPNIYADSAMGIAFQQYALEAIRLNAQPVDAQAQSCVPADFWPTYEAEVRPLPDGSRGKTGTRCQSCFARTPASRVMRETFIRTHKES